jgi:LPXTG-motif cell wall-anchored protein
MRTNDVDWARRATRLGAAIALGGAVLLGAAGVQASSPSGAVQLAEEEEEEEGGCVSSAVLRDLELSAGGAAGVLSDLGLAEEEEEEGGYCPPPTTSPATTSPESSTTTTTPYVEEEDCDEEEEEGPCAPETTTTTTTTSTTTTTTTTTLAPSTTSTTLAPATTSAPTTTLAPNLEGSESVVPIGGNNTFAMYDCPAFDEVTFQLYDGSNAPIGSPVKANADASGVATITIAVPASIGAYTMVATCSSGLSSDYPFEVIEVAAPTTIEQRILPATGNSSNTVLALGMLLLIGGGAIAAAGRTRSLRTDLD